MLSVAGYTGQIVNISYWLVLQASTITTRSEHAAKLPVAA